MQIKPLAITMGDPAGIGPEIVAKFFAALPGVPAIVVGDAGILTRAIALLQLDLHIFMIKSPNQAQFAPHRINLIAASALPHDLAFGKVDARAGKAAYDYVIAAIDMAKAGDISGIVTAPLAKESLKAAGLKYPGHTEILADKSATSDFAMMLANEHIKVILVSIHVSLKDAVKLVTRARVLKTIELAALACAAYCIEKPRIAVAGLNPHAGEDRMFGDEDADEIAPAIADARAMGLDASGPYPGDTVFMRAKKGEFDIVVAQYHDQGLIPVKYLGIENGVNVTIGLPFVRTSVDHGTAFDIAGTGKADANSLIYAYNQAVLLANFREKHGG